jgi:curved DNA-binding protein CbpA
MAPKLEVVEAFETLGLSIDADHITASKAYKLLALIHHPDQGDATATLRFQQIGAAWNICQ